MKKLDTGTFVGNSLKDIQQLLLKLCEKADVEYQEIASKFVEEWATKGMMSYQVDDNLIKELESRLKDSGISYLAFNNAATTEHVIFFPEAFSQQVESIALNIAKDHDLLSQTSKDEINDLCYAQNLRDPKNPMTRYEIMVPNELIANRLRETLTKENDLKITFSVDKNPENDTYTFTCPSLDGNKMNRAYFETLWSFAGQFEALNLKQEQYDLDRQHELEDRINQGGSYIIADPVIDEKGNATGAVREKIVITPETITLYKGDIVADSIQNTNSDQCLDTFQSWIDRQSRPIIIEDNEKDNMKELLIQRNPKIFLEEKDYAAFKADREQMYKIENKMIRCFNGEFNEKAWNAIMAEVARADERNLTVVSRTEQLDKLFHESKYECFEVTDKDLSTLNRVIELQQEHMKEVQKEERTRTTQKTVEKER